MNKKIKSFGVVAILIIAGAILFVPTGTSSTVEAPFGTWRIEVSSTDSSGNIHPMSVVNTLGGQMLQWTHGGADVTVVTCKLYASATGNGYDYCDIDCTNNEAPFYRMSLSVHLNYIDEDGLPHGYQGMSTPPPNEIIRLDVNGDEVLLIESVTPMSAFEGFSEIPPDETREYTLKWYFFAIPLIYRGVSGDTPDYWEEETVTLTVESNVEVTWEDEGPSCGDGVCANEPWPGENCKTCTDDCGICNSKMALVDATNLGTGLRGSTSGVTFHHGNDDYSWNEWTQITTPYHIEVFKNANAWSFYVWAETGTTGKTLKAHTYIEVDGVMINLIDTSWSDVGSVVTENTWYQLGYWTEWEELHRLIHDSTNYKLYISAWLEGGPNAHTLTVNPEESNDDHTLVVNLVGSVVDSTPPYTFSVNSGDYYNIKVDWYNTMLDGENKVTASKSGTMGSSDTTITINHPNVWYIVAMCDRPTFGPFYMYCTPPLPPMQYESPDGVWVFYRGAGTYEVEWDSQSGYGARTKSGTVVDEPIAIICYWESGAQFITNGMFSITSAPTSYSRYSYNGNYLGVI